MDKTKLPPPTDMKIAHIPTDKRNKKDLTFIAPTSMNLASHNKGFAIAGFPASFDTSVIDCLFMFQLMYGINCTRHLKSSKRYEYKYNTKKVKKQIYLHRKFSSYFVFIYKCFFMRNPLIILWVSFFNTFSH